MPHRLLCLSLCRPYAHAQRFRYPGIERVDGMPTYPDDITKALTKPDTAPEEPEPDAE
jgi:hypothetical protein